MRRETGFSEITKLMCVVALGALVGCSGGSSGDLVGVDDQESTAVDVAASAPVLDAVPTPETSGFTLEAVLRPGQAPNSIGEVRLFKAPGTANDELRTEATIDKDDFGVLDITPGNGFGDEVVRLVARRNGVQVFNTRLRFADNNPANIDFKRTLAGAAAPELRAGDFIQVIVNGHLALRGTLRD